MKNAVEIRGLRKSYGAHEVLKGLDFRVRQGEIFALLGVNGAGKTTALECIEGLRKCDAGSIAVHGRMGIQLQSASLPEHIRAMEAVKLFAGWNKTAPDREMLAALGIDGLAKKQYYQLSTGQKRRLHLALALIGNPDILFLDEPTAVLTPQETDRLFAVLRNMKKDGKSIIIITHKLNEVLAISDRVAILRKGEYIGVVDTDKTDQAQLTEMMVGRPISLEIGRPQVERGEKRLQVIDLTCLNGDGVKALDNVSFDAYGGEILGVAGIAGSGQKELCEIIAGLYPSIGGSVLYLGDHNGIPVQERILGLKPDEIVKKGISMAFVPEDRLGMGLVADMDMTDNVMLRSYKSNKGLFVDRKTPRELADKLIEELEIVTPGVDTPVGRLSGGNVQKVLLGREIACQPSVLIVAYPVRGLDINSSYRIYDLLNEQKKKGVAVIFIGEDLDVLMQLSDRIMVMCGGKVSGIVDPRKVTKEDIGLMMIHTGHSSAEDKKEEVTA